MVDRCIECDSSLTPLLVIDDRGIPHGNDGHSYQRTQRTLSRCTAGHGQLESYSHDCWSHDEDWDLTWWFLLSTADTTELAELARACPQPLGGTCACALHESLRHSSERLWATRGAAFASDGVRAARITLARD